MGYKNLTKKHELKSQKCSLNRPENVNKTFRKSLNSSIVRVTDGQNLGFPNRPIKSITSVQTKSPIIVPGTSLKSVIKSVNKRCLKNLKMQYDSSDPKTSLAGLRLAKSYIKSKDKSFTKEAIKILSNLILPEAKYIAMKLSIEHRNYSDAYYFANFLSITKCNCPTTSCKHPKPSKPKLNLEVSNGFPKIMCEAESQKPVCYKHKAEDLAATIVSAVGTSAAKSYKKQGGDLSYVPSYIIE